MRISIFLISLFLFSLLFSKALAQPGISNTSLSGGLQSIRLNSVEVTFSESIQRPSEGSITVSPQTNISINFSESFNDEVEIVFSDLLIPDEDYVITFNGIRNTADPAVEAGELSVTFTTGSAVTVNNALTENICIGDPEGKDVEPIIITENLPDNFFNTTNSGTTHSLILQVSDGFEFIDGTGQITLSGETDIVTKSIAVMSNKRRVQIEYTLCTLSGIACPAGFNSEKSDVITVSGLKVKAVNITNANNTYTITRINNTANGSGNDAEMPGLGGGTVFARLEVVNSPTLLVQKANITITEDQKFCFGGDITLKVKPELAGAEVQAGDVYEFFVRDLDTDYIKLNPATNPGFINAANANVITFSEDNIATLTNIDFPIEFYATLKRTGTCLATSNPINIDLTDTTGLNPNFIGDMQELQSTTSPSAAEVIDVRVVPQNGLLEVFRSIGESNQQQLIFSDSTYSSGDYTLNTLATALEEDEVTISVKYTTFTNEGCVAYSKTHMKVILPIPNIEEELDLLPSYCDNQEGNFPIVFKPSEVIDTAEYTLLSVEGIGLNGNVNSQWNPISETTRNSGYSFDVQQAFSSIGEEEFVSIDITYVSKVSRNVTQYEQVCRQETICAYEQECEIKSVCDDPIEPCRQPPCPIAQFRIPICQDRLVCEQVYRCRPKTVCTRDSVGFTVVETVDTLVSSYQILLTELPELQFSTVTGDSLNSVFCTDSGPILLLGRPGVTFENKRFDLVDLSIGPSSSRRLEEFSFTPGNDPGQLPATDEGYQLIYTYSQTTACNVTDTFTFKVVNVPDPVIFPSALPVLNDLPVYDYCLNSQIDSIRLSSSSPEIELIWRDDRGSILATGNSFLPDVETDRPLVERFTVEQRHVKGGCSSEVKSFFIQVGNDPLANFDYKYGCQNNAFFRNNNTHGGSKAQRDTIQNVFYNFNDGSDEGYKELRGSNFEHTFPSPGVYDVDMVVQTSIGCTDTITKKVTVFDEADYAIDNGKFSYAEDFTSGSNGWISTTDNDNASPQARNSSWGIRELEGLTGWHAFNEQTGSYNDNEYSWVQSPYFNLSNWNSPKLQMDILFDTPELEGAVLQYMIKDCDNTEGSDIWIPVGRANGGLAWYNNGSISSGPGGSITGWSGISKNNNVGSNTSDSWQTVAYDLAGVRAVAGNNLVQFRIAFASLNLGVNRESGRKGFAFTNFIISEKERISLVENFTHINSQDGLRENVSDFSKAREDVVYIEYHTGRPAGDPLYFGYHFAENTSNDGATRAFVYGLDGPGYTIVNGRFQSFDPFTVGWGERQYTQETLLAPAFDLSLDYTYQEGEPLKVKAMAIRNENIVPLIDTAQQPQLMSLKVAVVEKEVTEYTQDTLRNVFVKYLGQHPGAFEEKTWKAGSSDSLILEEEWQIPVDAESGRFGLVAWIELARDSPEKGPKGLPFNNVFQAAEMSINTELVAVEVLSNRKTLAGNWVVYPNPAADFLQVQRQENIQSAIEWQVVNALGSIVKKGKYIGGNSGFEVNLAGLNAGIYMLQLNSREGQLQKKFVKK